jgi:hypothetical protein
MSWVYLCEDDVKKCVLSGDVRLRVLLELAAQLRIIEFDLNELRNLRRGK